MLHGHRRRGSRVPVGQRSGSRDDAHLRSRPLGRRDARLAITPAVVIAVATAFAIALSDAATVHDAAILVVTGEIAGNAIATITTTTAGAGLNLSRPHAVHIA
ncbi:hypothetical protein Rmet_6613 (plasmid) [Cupriavidus metallidurans CH34]|uniref:Uncharacterized protein n=1 Tax=Cupriavidus metallidurans (strain ATCC 43123 / DSM 2839 / NBRC 102507 / CH34) TaxID=266264 RepID=D3DY42_CUPMC|nr:hypothetical protein Rmet_6613 [Cupriavidus metallidurans CH34]